MSSPGGKPRSAMEMKRFRAFREKGTQGIQFLTYITHLQNRGLSDRTVETYGDCLLTLRRWMLEAGRKKLAELTANDLGDFQVWLSQQRTRSGKIISANYQGTHIAVVRELFAFLRREGKMLANPATDLRYPKVGRKIRRDVLTPEELRDLLSLPVREATEQRDAVALRLMVLSSLRARKLVALDLDDIDLAAREVIVRHAKGNKDRLTFFDRSTRPLLAQYLAQGRERLRTEDTSALLIGRSGSRLPYHELREIVKVAARQAGISTTITPHSLRRSFCTLLLSAGCNLKVIAELAGHSSLKTTAHYTRVGIDELSRVYRQAHPRAGL